MPATISLPSSSSASPDISSPSPTLVDSPPSSPGLLVPSWQAAGVYVPVHKRRQGIQSSTSSPAMSTFELEPDTHRPTTYTREALLQIAKSPFVPLAPSSELLHAFPNIIRAHGHGIDQALTMSSGMRYSKSFHKYSGGHWEHHGESKARNQHGRSRSYGRNKKSAAPRVAYSSSSSDQSDHDSVHELSSGSDSESHWRHKY